MITQIRCVCVPQRLNVERHRTGECTIGVRDRRNSGPFPELSEQSTVNVRRSGIAEQAISSQVVASATNFLERISRVSPGVRSKVGTVVETIEISRK